MAILAMIEHGQDARGTSSAASQGYTVLQYRAFPHFQNNLRLISSELAQDASP
jgi:hypothetical protein